MLTKEDNELLCRVEGDAPMGQMMRRQWIPALLSEEISEPDGAPVPIRLFGENLVAFRDTDGKVGLMDRDCPHRRASLVFGRNENNGLRCLYHGWKLDVNGLVTEMPSEPPEFRQQTVQHKAYPTHEHGGFVWAYMGPKETMPPFTPPPWAPHPDSKTAVIKIKADCNWAQVLEGAIDSAHSSSLHSSDITPSSASGGTRPKGNVFLRPSNDKAPRIQVEPTEYGFKYAALRKPIVDPEVNDYCRITVFVAPATVLIPPNMQYNLANLNVPIDDTHTFFHFIAWVPGPEGGIEQEEYRKIMHAQVGIDLDKGYDKVKRNVSNNYLQDRNAMKAGNFSGITGIPFQDFAMWETMAPIADRSIERLAASDLAVVAFRRRMLDAVKQFMAGNPAIGTAEATKVEKTQIASFEGMISKDGEWRHLDMHNAQKQRLQELEKLAAAEAAASTPKTVKA